MDIWVASISLAINSTDTNIAVQASLYNPALILLYIYPEVELLDHMAGLFENSGEMVMPFS